MAFGCGQLEIWNNGMFWFPVALKIFSQSLKLHNLSSEISKIEANWAT